ncbi:MAG: hypothetical protein LC687_05110 [Actinobacteria bacterium]|nr:hypothetical protein [Actinomycetota bacterium]
MSGMIQGGVLTPDKLRRIPASHVPLAHELGHVLGCLEEGESQTEKNLMSQYIPLKNDRLTKKQCDEIKKSPLLKVL